MKKTNKNVLLVVLTLVCVLSAGALAGAAKYKDGPVIGFSDGDRYGYTMALVIMQNDKIVSVALTETDGFGVAKPASYPWPEYHEAMKVLPQRFVAANSADIDGIAKATGTSTAAIQAVSRALEKALIVKPAGKYQDGTFFGKASTGGSSTGVAWVTIKNDKIVAVEVDEILPDGTWKDWATYPWVEAVEGRAVMEQRFIEANGPDVDTVTKATGSGLGYIEAVTKALEAAKK